jgi:hypothetical protein
MTVMVTIPEGLGPGMMQVDPDGLQGPLPPVLVWSRYMYPQASFCAGMQLQVVTPTQMECHVISLYANVTVCAAGHVD